MPRRKGPPPDPGITDAHFRALTAFGKNPKQRKMNEEEREKLWQLVCSTAGLNYVPHKAVVAAWKRFIEASSKVSGIAINGEFDPKYTSVGITYKRKIVAAHTTKTDAMLKRLMSIHAKSFSSQEEFLTAMETMAKSIGEKKK